MGPSGFYLKHLKRLTTGYAVEAAIQQNPADILDWNGNFGQYWRTRWPCK